MNWKTVTTMNYFIAREPITGNDCVSMPHLTKLTDFVLKYSHNSAVVLNKLNIVGN